MSTATPSLATTPRKFAKAIRFEEAYFPSPSPVGWQIKTLSDALNATTERPPWVIEDLLMQDSATLVSAQPHAMKSLSLSLLYACVESVATGKVWGHFKANLHNTLFIETEDPPYIVEARIRGFATGLKIDPRTPGFHCGGRSPKQPG